MVQISAIGADKDSESAYSRTKAKGEEAVLRHMPRAVILRPSVMFGPEDDFFNRFAGMTRFGPILPVVGAETRFQPAYVDDVAHAAVLGAEGRAAPGIYELGGPEVATFRALMQRMLAIVHRRRLVVNMPFFIAWMMAFGFDMMQKVTLGLITNGILTRDQLHNLRRDNVVSDDAKGFDKLGITPKAMATILPEYLWRFRPSGQYDDIRDSARNLRSDQV